MASAWLIRRFIDPEARFAFAPDRDSLPTGDPVPYDMFGVEFSHQGDGCTLETLCRLFGIEDAAVVRLAAIVHDLDLKDARFGAADAPTVASLIEGLQLTHSDDDALLERGISLFEALYCAFAQSLRAAGPRPVAKQEGILPGLEAFPASAPYKKQDVEDLLVKLIEKLGGKARPALVKALESKYPLARMTAAMSLEHLGRAADAPALEAIAKDTTVIKGFGAGETIGKQASRAAGVVKQRV